jgi:hypothetical protein
VDACNARVTLQKEAASNLIDSQVRLRSGGNIIRATCGTLFRVELEIL